MGRFWARSPLFEYGSNSRAHLRALSFLQNPADRDVAKKRLPDIAVEAMEEEAVEPETPLKKKKPGKQYPPSDLLRGFGDEDVQQSPQYSVASSSSAPPT